MAGGEPADAELLRRHVAGDLEAFGLLFSRHKDRLWAVALRTVCDPEDAADALQEAMISAFRRAADFRGDSAVTTWLHRIVVNACLDRLRRKQTRSVTWSGDPDALDALAAQAASLDSAEAIETRLDVDAALRTLPAEQRAALVLVDMLGYSVADAAEILGVSAGTVKSRCARGRSKLLPHLSHLRTSSPGGGNRPGAASVSSEQEGGV
jgi:RNA polymerase sigma-70 factor, ECF subfamily